MAQVSEPGVSGVGLSEPAFGPKPGTFAGIRNQIYSMRRNLKIKLPQGFSESQFLRRLSDRYRIRKEPIVSRRFEVCDTFDWRLFNASLALESCGSTLALRNLDSGDALHRLEISRQPVFIRDFPDSDLKNLLAPVVKMRALLRLAEIRSRSRTIQILNPDEKTVARLVLEEIRTPPSGGKPARERYLGLKSVRGYPKYARQLAKTFQAEGLTSGVTEKEFFIEALTAAGKTPGGYSSKVDIRLDAAMRSDQAAQVILRCLLAVMRTNEAVFERDLDTEILHDFRVALRRTRSALTQIKHVFPARTTGRFRKAFAHVGKLSNPLRDLDVYLLNQDDYKAVLPPALREEIDPLFAHLRRKRASAFRQVLRALKSKKHATTMKDWETFLQRKLPETPTAAHATLPAIDLARRRIYKKFRRILDAGSKIRPDTEDEKLHALRIECKKLRYLMEFFATLFPPKKIKALIAQLKKLQDNLGDYNDLCVQQDYLLRMAAELPGDRQRQGKTLVAVGSLVESLNRRKQTLRDAFAGTFAEFAAPKNRALFRELFAFKSK